MVRTSLNAISKEWETFVKSIMGRANLPDWKELWATLPQEEIRQLSKTGSSSKGFRIKKEEEEDATLIFMGKQKKRKKKDVSKIKCFSCGELRHYVNQCLRKKTKGDASNSKVKLAKAEKEIEEDDDCAMNAHVLLEKRWGDIEL